MKSLKFGEKINKYEETEKNWGYSTKAVLYFNKWYII